MKRYGGFFKPPYLNDIPATQRRNYNFFASISTPIYDDCKSIDCLRIGGRKFNGIGNKRRQPIAIVMASNR
jgi:hypothetical protein